MKKIIKRWAVPALTVIFVSIFPAVFLYGNNANEADIQDVLEPMLLFAAGALVFFGVNALISRSPNKSAVVTVLFMLVFENFAGLENLLLAVFPGLYYWHTIAIFLFVLVHLAFLVYRFLPKDMEGTAASVLCLVFGGLVVINLLTAIPGEINKWNARQLEEEKKQQSEAGRATVEGQTDLPNIYLLIFDEFAGFNQIEKYYHYDNTQLKESLEDLGFTVSMDSHNESIMTSTVTTNLVNLDYIVDNYVPASEKDVLRENGALFSLLSEMGYDVRKITTNAYYGEDFSVEGVSSSASAVTATGDDLNALLWKKTIFYPWCVKISGEEIMIADFMASDGCIETPPAFTLAHMLITHTPFYFDENGIVRPSNEWDNWRDDSIYLGVYKLASKKILSIAENLTENDPEALILIMSDHGARASTDSELFMEKFELNDINNFFNAFYYRGEDLSQYKDLSAVNTLRMMLNLAVRTEYDQVEVPVDEYKYK